MSLSLTPYALGWIRGLDDDPADLCAHGHVIFEIDGTAIVPAAPPKRYTVSAAALYLLRTLSPGERITDQDEPLFPCCGHTMWALPDSSDVFIQGCGLGCRVGVRASHHGDQIIVEPSDGLSFVVDRSSWQAAVLHFADTVEQLYAASAAKAVTDLEIRAGFSRFISEWERRRGRRVAVRLA
jgi:hypothetical protein